MSFLDKMNQTIQNVWNELTGREKVVTEAKTKAPATYGSILASSKVEHTALTRICGAKIREMQVTELSSEDLREIKDFIRRDGDTWIIIRDSQKFHFPNWAMEKLVSTNCPSTLPPRAALARPAPMEAATSATVTGWANSRNEPSGRVI